MSAPAFNSGFMDRKAFQNDCIVTEASKTFGIRTREEAYYLDGNIFILDEVTVATCKAFKDAGFDPAKLHVANIEGGPGNWKKGENSKRVVNAVQALGGWARESTAIDYFKEVPENFSIVVLDACCSLPGILDTAKYVVANRMACVNGCALLWLTVEMNRTHCHDSLAHLTYEQTVVARVKEIADLGKPSIMPPVIEMSCRDIDNKMYWVRVKIRTAAYANQRHHQIQGKRFLTVYKDVREDMSNDHHYVKGVCLLHTDSLLLTYAFADGEILENVEERDDVTMMPFEGAKIGYGKLGSDVIIGAEVRKKFGTKKQRKIFNGRVIAVDTSIENGETLYAVLYEDGDSEDLTLEELEKLLLKRTEPSSESEPSAKKQKKEE